MNEYTELLEALEIVEEFFDSLNGGSSYVYMPDGERITNDWGYFSMGVSFLKEWAKSQRKG